LAGDAHWWKRSTLKQVVGVGMGAVMPTEFAASSFWLAFATVAAVPLGRHLWIGGLPVRLLTT
jgi:hypothetical protein